MKGVAFRPVDLGMYIAWAVTVILLLVLPLFFSSGFAISLLSQMGIMIVFALSYNVIFGQGGMLSFGHAVYSGLGAFFAIHALNWVGDGRLWLPVSMIPLVGGVFGAIFGVLFGYVTTKKAGTPFAMITLGIGELVFAASLMFPDFFGGEGGISTNRVVGEPFLGITFGPGIQVYYLIAVWCFVSMIAMYAFSHTPLGRISNAVRDNPERAEFIGYSAQHVRFFVIVVSAWRAAGRRARTASAGRARSRTSSARRPNARPAASTAIRPRCWRRRCSSTATPMSRSSRPCGGSPIPPRSNMPTRRATSLRRSAGRVPAR